MREDVPVEHDKASLVTRVDDAYAVERGDPPGPAGVEHQRLRHGDGLCLTDVGAVVGPPASRRP